MPTREEMPKLIGIVLSRSPKVVLKVSWRYLRAKKKAQRAEKVFRRRLRDRGMDEGSIDRLAEMYISTVSLRSMMKELGIPGPVFSGDDGTGD